MQFNEAINNATKFVSMSVEIENKKYFLVSLLLFNIVYSSKKRTPNLDLLYKDLLSIKPISTENERVFFNCRKFYYQSTDHSLNAIGVFKGNLINKTVYVILFACVNRYKYHRNLP